jgi:hypothetical protein
LRTVAASVWAITPPRPALPRHRRTRPAPAASRYDLEATEHALIDAQMLPALGFGS